MFDNSFKRSKDYFVALQILRIIDEWLDEVQSTVEDMSKDDLLLKASMWGTDYESHESFEVAVRYVNEHATTTKSRVQKKREEINSLRDGVSPCHRLVARDAAYTHFTAFQCHVSS